MQAQTPGQGAFDARRPPDPALIGECVHCGFCLPSCPTYALWGEEMDSPRGRIYLMREGSEGEPLGPSMVEHFDRCLGCMACVTACPSGVRYDQLITAARAQVERRYARPSWERLLRGAVFALFPHPRRLGALRRPLRMYQRSGLPAALRSSGLLGRMPAALQAMEQMLPAVSDLHDLPAVIPATGPLRGRVGLLTGCVQRVFFSQVNAATARVLAAEGFEVVVPPTQGCCGALSGHAGREEEAMAYARSVIDCFEAAGVEAVIVNSAGCGSAMKEYGHLLRDDPAYAGRAEAAARRTADIAEFLAAHPPAATRHRLEMKVAYHDACHLAHAQGVRDEPRSLLSSVPGLELVEVPGPDQCCGSAGVYNILQPAAAAELGDRKATSVAATGADLLVAANPGCTLQISAALRRRGQVMPVAHTVEVLDASLRGLSPEALTCSGK